MKKDKFLTVFAVFDDDTQQILKKYQDSILDLGYTGTQTMDIPFHISLGSYPISCEKELIERIKSVCESNSQFDIKLDKVNHFNNKVLFLQPEENVFLRKLHELFDNNYADGFPWHAHATIFCGNESDVQQAKEILTKNFQPLKTNIVSIQMGEFFPTRMIVSKDLCKE